MLNNINPFTARPQATLGASTANNICTSSCVDRQAFARVRYSALGGLPPPMTKPKYRILAVYHYSWQSLYIGSWR
ncbi:hypothetical protein J6590_035582 [Homalodisca vitripennis]|nr:hypothetical protein J6590_035582 [Homalodisca vitripennis]